MNEAASILAIGDVHLGTACSGLPDGMGGLGVEPADVAPAAALRLTVDYAINQRVDAVLFAGDVVESTNARFEAMLPLEESVQRLFDAGIEVIAVAGNHDVDALPRLQQLIGGFRLLGKDGRWEAATLSRGATPFVEVVGWSFPEKYVRESPLALLLGEPLPAPPTPVPRIGLLHCDLGASGGYYAPVRQSELDDTGYDAWLLGHIHKPSLKGQSASDGARASGYLGSLVGLDPSETGPHGPWLLTISTDGRIDLEQAPIAPLRWERIEVSMDGIEHVADVPDRLLAVAVQQVEALAQAGPLPRALGLRATLTGTSAVRDDIRKWVADGASNDALVRRVNDTVVFYEGIVDGMRLLLDLASIAADGGPAGLLAQRLLLLGQDNEQSGALLDAAHARLGAIAGEDVWYPVNEHRNATDPVSADALRDYLLRSGRAALSAMLAGRRAGEGS